MALRWHLRIEALMRTTRSSAVLLCSELVRVGWRDSSQLDRQVVANLEELSAGEVILQSDSPIPKQSAVRIICPKSEFRGTVQSCSFQDTGYFLGVRLEPDCRWSRRRYSPKHLLDPWSVMVHHLLRELHVKQLNGNSVAIPETF